MSTLKPLIVILGPTASGKSELALKLTKKIKGEIISADSRQIYKEMDIGTAKLTLNSKRQMLNYTPPNLPYKGRNKNYPRILPLLGGVRGGKLKPIIVKNVPHYLIDIIKPNENFSVAEYKELAIKIIRDIQNRGKVPILVGGTGLYISAIVDNIEIPKVKPNLTLRKKLEKISLSLLLKKLEKLDQKTFETIDKNNKRRIIRALEVTISTEKPFSTLREKGEPLFDCLQIGLDVPRKKLYKKIDQRVEKMINPERSERVNGERSRTIQYNLIQETKKLSKKYSWKLPSMSGIGYKEIGMYLQGEISLEKATELIKFATHSYARRQMTWFRRNSNIQWIKNYSQAEKLIKNFLAET